MSYADMRRRVERGVKGEGKTTLTNEKKPSGLRTDSTEVSFKAGPNDPCPVTPAKGMPSREGK